MKQKILIVDDEPDALELVKVNLVNAGFTVITAEDGDQAIKKARANLPDLILLDLMLPEVDGLEVCKILRRDSATATIPIIMLTAKATEVDRDRCPSREQLLRDVWDSDTAIDGRTIDTHLRRLRETLGPASKYLDPVRGGGDRFVEA